MEYIMNQLNIEQPTATTHECNHIPQLLNIKDVMKYTGLSRSSIYEMINEDSDRYDPTFPKKVQLSKVRVAWVAQEVAEWINSKISQRMV